MRVFTGPGMKGLRQQGPVLSPTDPWPQMRCTCSRVSAFFEHRVDG